MSTSKHSKTGSRRPLTSIRLHVTTGVAGAAMIGAGTLLTTPPGAPVEGVELTSSDSVAALSLSAFTINVGGAPGGAR